MKDDDFDDDAPDTGSNNQRLDRLERRLAINEIRSQTGLDDAKAAEVYECAKGSKLDMREALAVLRQRRPADFGDFSSGEPQFGSLTPRPGSAPPIRRETDDTERRMAYAKSLRTTSKREMHALADNMIGESLAKELGWQHERLPLPPR